jgi:glycosyltransferase involved in cell wall biosynthesis
LADQPAPLQAWEEKGWTVRAALKPQSSELPNVLPRSRRLRLLQSLTLAQHGISVKELLAKAGSKRFDAIYSPFTDYLFDCSEMPQVITCHDLTPLFGPGSKRARLRYRMWTPVHLHKAQHVIAISGFVAGQLTDLGLPASRISVVPNGVEIIRAPVVSPGSFNWVVLARHDRNKNLDLAVRGFSGFLQKQPDWPGALMIIGRRGRETPVLALLVRELGIEGRVQFVESVEEHRLVDLLRSAYGLLAPSCMEGFDYPVLEAKAEGIPTLISDIPVHREFHQGSSLFFPLDRDGAGLASCMNELTTGEQYWQQLSVLGRDCARQLSLQRQVEAIQIVLRQVSS